MNSSLCPHFVPPALQCPASQVSWIEQRPWPGSVVPGMDRMGRMLHFSQPAAQSIPEPPHGHHRVLATASTY